MEGEESRCLRLLGKALGYRTDFSALRGITVTEWLLLASCVHRGWGAASQWTSTCCRNPRHRVAQFLAWAVRWNVNIYNCGEASLNPNRICNRDSCCFVFFLENFLLSPGETGTLRQLFLQWSACFLFLLCGLWCGRCLLSFIDFRHATINLASALFGNECLLRVWGMIETYTSIQRVNRSEMIENAKPGVKHSPEF